ncbi:hypothetical protein RCG23_12505 [Neobacillus sp. PS3-34]|nr:hypothetical protein [Neobacillus sp. PS3-34]WML50450.1 hypothetical protein RCG23_12505 [Neobacillus sp. PS3-34]
MDMNRYRRKIYLEDKPRETAKNELLAAFQLPLKTEYIPATEAWAE